MEDNYKTETLYNYFPYFGGLLRNIAGNLQETTFSTSPQHSFRYFMYSYNNNVYVVPMLRELIDFSVETRFYN